MACRTAAIGERLWIGREAKLFGHQPRRIVDARPAPVGVGGDQPAADCESGDARRPFDQREFGRPAADIDVQHGMRRAPCDSAHGARAMRREAAFQQVTGGRADELPASSANSSSIARAFVPLDRLAGQDHRAAIDLAALNPACA